jgi:predicted dehydrogenase
MIRVGLIGCGDIASCHVTGYLAIPEEARVTAVSDVVEASAQLRARELGGARMFGDFRALIAEADVDAVDICLPHHLHKDAIIAAAAAGKHILCEKPLCLNWQQAQEISRAIKASGVTLMCAHNQLYYTAVRRARELLDDGLLGQIYEVRTVEGFRLTKVEMASMLSWRGKKETMGGGELIDTGYHSMYMLLHLADSKPVEVTAMLSKHRVNVIDGEDSAQVLVRFANGAVGNVLSSWAYNLRKSAWRFEVIGERGQLFGRRHELQYRIHDFEPATLMLPEVDSFSEEVADFVACLRDRRQPLQSEAHGVEVLKVILAAYRSQEEKRTIDLSGDEWAAS